MVLSFVVLLDGIRGVKVELEIVLVFVCSGGSMLFLVLLFMLLWVRVFGVLMLSVVMVRVFLVMSMLLVIRLLFELLMDFLWIREWVVLFVVWEVIELLEMRFLVVVNFRWMFV